MKNPRNTIGSFEVNLILTWLSPWVTIHSAGEGKFAITHTKLYGPVVTLSKQDNAKFLQQLNSGFKRTINSNKYQSDPKKYEQNINLNHLVDQPFQGVNRLSFSLTFSTFTGIMKKLLKTTQNKKKKHNRIVILATSKLNSIESKNIWSINK